MAFARRPHADNTGPILNQLSTRSEPISEPVELLEPLEPLNPLNHVPTLPPLRRLHRHAFRGQSARGVSRPTARHRARVDAADRGRDELLRVDLHLPGRGEG